MGDGVWNERKLPLRRTGRHSGQMRCQREPAIYRLVFYKGNEVTVEARSQNEAWEEDGKCTAEGTGENRPAPVLS